MSIISDIADAAGVAVLRLLGMELIRYADCAAVLREMARRDLALLGFDGFEYDEAQATVRPRMDWIADYGPRGYPAAQLLADRPLMFSTQPDPFLPQTAPDAPPLALEFVLRE